MDTRIVRRRFWIEAFCALVGAALFVLTLFSASGSSSPSASIRMAAAARWSSV